MIDLKKSKYYMNFTLKENMEEAELFQKVTECLNTKEEYIIQKIAFDSPRFCDYEEEEAASYVKEHGFLSIRLKREKMLKYELYIDRKKGNLQYLILEWKDQMNQKKWNDFVKLSEVLIAAFQPDIAWLKRNYHVEQPFLNRTEELLEMMTLSALAGKKYEEYGPGGLGLITYLSEDFISRLGIERVKEATIKSNKTSWGAAALSLAEYPCEVSEEELAAVWESAMDYLSPAHFFGISMPSLKKDLHGFELYGERGVGFGIHNRAVSGYQGFRFWKRNQLCYEGRNYLDLGEYEKAAWVLTKDLEQCKAEEEIIANSIKEIALRKRAKAFEMMEQWEEAVQDLNSLIEAFGPAFEEIGGWCKNCNDFLVYNDDEYPIIDQCIKAGYWPYQVSNRGYVYVKRKWHLEPGNVKNTDFKDLPDSWCCPYCGAPKHDFVTQRVQKKEAFEQAEIYMNRGKLFEKLGKQELAKADFEMALSLNAMLRLE